MFLHILKMQMNICLRDLPTQKNSTLPPRGPTHAYADCKISVQQPTQLYKEFPRVHEVGHWEKNDAHIKKGGRIILPNFRRISPCFIGFPICVRNAQQLRPPNAVSVSSTSSSTRRLHARWTNVRPYIAIPKIDNLIRRMCNMYIHIIHATIDYKHTISYLYV